MKKILVALIVVTGVALFMADYAGADSFTTGFTFTLPEPYPLHHVYVGTRGSGFQEGFEDILLPAGAAFDGGNISPAGFDVPTGSSSFDLVTFLLSQGMGAPNPSTHWAVAGLWTDGAGVDHVVLGTNADLTGVPLSTPLAPLLGGEAGVIAWLKSGQFGPEGLGVWGGVVERLNSNGYMRPFGETAQLFFFSNGQIIQGASVTANAFGQPIEENVIPEPGTLMLFGSGALSMMGYAFQRRKRAA